METSTRVVIVGQGYVGLPLAMAAAEAGMDVTGVDLDKRRVESLNEGKSPVGDVSDADIQAVLDAGRYRAAAEFDAVEQANVVVLCVPTPYHSDAPDLSFVEGATRAVGAFLRPRTLVILESTTYPGTTEELLLPMLENASGLVAGASDGFDLAFSPERIDPGNPRFGLRNTPKIVGGITDAATERAAKFYGAFVDSIVRVSDPKTAEMAKLLENTFRHINIALANEMALICRDLGVNVWEVIRAASSKPFGFMPFYPGPGVGGHCIPVDPLYLSWRARQFGGAAKFIELARDVNAAMPTYCVNRVQDLLNERGKAVKGAHVLVLGVAYKGNISDMRESPALPLIDGLLRKGASVSYHDPFVPEMTTPAGHELVGVNLTSALVRSADCVLVVTNHGGVDYSMVVAEADLVFDTRNIPEGCGKPNVFRL
jgi:UDP-N-acetyl-D-glucosamine dehydrogenase